MEEILLCNVCMHLTNVRIVRGILWFHKIKIRKLNFALVIWRTFVPIQNLPNFSSEYSSFIRWKIFLSSYERTFVTWKIFHQTKVGLDWHKDSLRANIAISLHRSNWNGHWLGPKSVGWSHCTKRDLIFSEEDRPTVDT